MDQISARLVHEVPIKWLFLGDSITHGAYNTNGWRDYTQLFAERIRYELGRSRDIIVNMAVSGNTTREFIQDFEWRVLEFRPHIILLMLGMNDCAENRNLPPEEFERNLSWLCTRCQEVGARLVLQTTCPIWWPEQPIRARLPQYMELVRQAAADRNLPLVDHFHYWNTEIEKYPPRQKAWMNDAIHPNEFGHRVFAEYLLREMGGFDAESPLGKLLLLRE